MKRTKIIICGAIIGIVAVLTLYFYRQLPYTPSTHDVVELMEQMDQDVKVDRDGDILWDLAGIKTLIRVGDKSILYYVAFEDMGDIEKANVWNQGKSFSRAYTEDGRAVLECDMFITEGVTTLQIAEFLRICIVSTLAWITELDLDTHANVSLKMEV